MRFFAGLVFLSLFVVMVGCVSNNITVVDNFRKNYSIEVEGLAENAISDGLPEGLDVNKVSKSIFNDVASGLADNGLTTNDNRNKYVVKYNISYLGHKWKGGFKPRYILVYNIQLIEKTTGNVIASDKNDEDDPDLLNVIENVSGDIVSFVTDNIK